jgi:DNA-binding transcriptional ArsR family regulator/uncharacterized protein YndB with AHSA1/START domain
MLPLGNMIKKKQALIWKALSEATRRSILELLKEQPRTTGFLCDHFRQLSRFAVMKHLGILHDAGLVIIKREGKFRWNFINGAPIQEIYDRWMSRYAAPLTASMLGLKRHLEQSPKGDRKMSAPKEVSTKHIELELVIQAPRERVWQAIVKEIGKWWRKDFYVHENARFVLEANPGGRLYEDAGNGAGGLWGSIMNIAPPKWLQWVGHLAPQYGGPATSIVDLRLEEFEGATKLYLTDALFGRLQEEAQKQIYEGWRLLFEEGLKTFVERGKKA